MQHESRGRRLWLLIVLGSLTMFSALATDMYLPAFPEVADALGVQPGKLRLTLTTFMFGVGVGQALYGPLSDRFGRKRPLMVGITIYVVASLMCTMATSLPEMTFWRFIQALGGSAGIVIARAFVRDHYTGVELAHMMTAMGVVFALAPALAPSLGALMLEWGDWRWIFGALAAFGVYALLASLTLDESHPAERRTDHGVMDSLRSYLDIARNRDYLRAVIAVAGGSVTTFAYISAAPAVFLGEYGMSSREFAVLFGVNSLAMVLAAQINVRVLPRLGVRKSLVAFTRVQITAALLFVPIAFLRLPVGVVLICTAIATGINSVILGNGLTLAVTPFGDRAGSASALVGLLQMTASALTAAAMSLVEGSAAPFMAAGMLTGAVMSFVFVRRAADPEELPAAA